MAAYLCKVSKLVDKQTKWVEKLLLTEQDAVHCPFRKHAMPATILKWTAKKTDLIELLYALHAAGCFNSGKISLNRIAACFEEVFHTDLSHFSRDFYEMRIRLNRIPFMDNLKILLVKRMDDPQKPFGKG